MTWRGLEFRAIARKPEKLEAAGLDATQILVGQVTEPESIRGCCQGVDVVFSAVGITRQKDGLTYMDVDYQANRNLLDEALRAGVPELHPHQPRPRRGLKNTPEKGNS